MPSDEPQTLDVGRLHFEDYVRPGDEVWVERCGPQIVCNIDGDWCLRDLTPTEDKARNRRILEAPDA